MMRILRKSAAALLSVAAATSALKLNVNDAGSIRENARTIAYGMMKYYTGNITNTPATIGVLPGPYYWWEAGAMWGALLDYYHITGDSTYNAVTTQALLSQVGPKWDYMVPLHQKDEGNDDQAFWGFATMSAAEKNYPQPTVGQYSWLQLTENLWNTQVARWDTSTCGGGLKWQIFKFNNGYDYKNSVSNGAFFQLSARLARFTGNQTYVQWAEKSYNWTRDIGLINADHVVFDGTNDLVNCTTQDQLVWTYNNGIFMYGSAVMYNLTGDALWSQRTSGFLNAAINFFSPYDNATNIMFEPACETVDTCNDDQHSFKAYLSRFMYATTLLAPFTHDLVFSLLVPSSEAAAQSCTGGTDGVTCGSAWYVGGWDGKFGVGQQLSALETIQGLLIAGSTPPSRGAQVQNPPVVVSPTLLPLPSSTIASIIAPIPSTSAAEVPTTPPIPLPHTSTPAGVPVSILSPTAVQSSANVQPSEPIHTPTTMHTSTIVPVISSDQVSAPLQISTTPLPHATTATPLPASTNIQTSLSPQISTSVHLSSSIKPLSSSLVPFHTSVQVFTPVQVSTPVLVPTSSIEISSSLQTSMFAEPHVPTSVQSAESVSTTVISEHTSTPLPNTSQKSTNAPTNPSGVVATGGTGATETTSPGAKTTSVTGGVGAQPSGTTVPPASAASDAVMSTTTKASGGILSHGGGSWGVDRFVWLALGVVAGVFMML